MLQTGITTKHNKKEEKKDFSSFHKNYQLLAVDIDGTLLNDSNQITQNTYQALKVMKEHGFLIILATGRLYPDAFYFAKYLDLFSPMILLHGALVQSYEGEILKEKDLPPEVIVQLIKIAREKDVSFQAFRTDCLVIEKRTAWNDLYLKYSPNKPEIICVPDMCHFLENRATQFAFLGEKSEILHLKEFVKKHLRNTVSIACAHPNLLEIVAPNVSKGNALRELADIKNIPLSQTIAIGDSYNDIEMIETAGLGVAMGNAPRKVKDAADFITKDNNHDGIAYFVSKFLIHHRS
jgi:Cof subfamily protein (haloacid dehalogenase superfamily)